MLRALTRILPAPDRRRLVALTAWLTAAAVLHGIVLGFVGVVVAAALNPDRERMRAMIALAAAALAFITVQSVAQTVAFRVGGTTARALHERLGAHMADLPLGWFTPARQASVIEAGTTGVPQLMSYPAILLRPAITALITPPAAALTLALLDWRYSLTVLAATVIALGASRYGSRLARAVDARRHRTAAEATDRILEYADRQPLIRTDQRPDDTEALDRALDEVRAASLRSAGTVIPGLVLFGVTLNALFAALIAAGAAWTADATLTTPVFVGVLVVTARLTAIASAGADLAAGLRLQQGALARLAQILSTPPLPVLGAAPESTEPAGTDIAGARHVSFRYGDRPVLENVSFALPRRGLTALVGPSGAGKTTLLRLLTRFWDPTDGHITLDGADLRTLRPEDLYARIGSVLQDDHLLDTTIRENIRAARPDAPDTDLAAAVRAAGLEHTVAQLPDGLDSPAGPDGRFLSGGERQRVCVARALLKAAPLTLMDEATSALDPENARLIGEAAHHLAAAGSVLLITHDLETVRRADQILVLDRGRIVQRGAHDDLSAEDGLYCKLVLGQDANDTY